MTAFFTLMLFMYPPLAHWSIYQGRPGYALHMLGVLCILPAILPLYQRRRLGLASGSAMLLGMILLLFPRWQAISMMQITPVVINALLCVLFTSSMGLGKTPLITRAASIMRGGSMPLPVIIYTRKVTIVWSLFFFMLAVSSLLLAIFASLETWSLFTNLISYLLIAGLFVVEYWYRRRHLGELVDYSFIDFVKGLFKLDYTQIFRSR